MSNPGTTSENGAGGNLFPIFQKNYKPPVNPLKTLQIVLNEAASPKQSKIPRKSLLGKSELPGMRQSLLDAGQKHIGPRFCKDCGLLYSPGDVQDEEEHRKAHRQLANLFTIKLWKDANIIQSFADGGSVVSLNYGSSPRRGGQLSRLKDFTAWVDAEVGGEETISQKSTLFLYVVPTKRKNEVRILGAVTVELLDSDQIITSAIQNEFEKPENSNNENCETVKMNLILGISRLWTDFNFRRRQIASRLCDTARFHSGIPGFVVPKKNLGILEPSIDGCTFFTKYTEGEGGLYSYKHT